MSIILWQRKVLYGLLRTDTTKWTYHPKERFYAMEQLFKFVLPGFQRIGIETPRDKPTHIYNEWLHTLRNIPLAAFVSQDGKQFTLTGMNGVEKNVVLKIRLTGAALSNQALSYYRTSKKEHCLKVSTIKISGNFLDISLPPHCIFTVTTIRSSISICLGNYS